MKIKTEPAQIWQEYQDGIAYNHAMNLYESQKKCENFFNGKQWEGVNAPDLDKPVFNILKRIANMQISFIASDDIAVSLKPYIDDGKSDAEMKIITNEIDKAFEYAQIKKENRAVLRDGFVQGDGCMHLFFDTSKQTGTAATGIVGAESIDITNFFFGNPADNNVQAQPYIIILMRRYVDDVRREAVEHGTMTEQEAQETIIPDSDTNMLNEDIADNELVSVLVKYWKEGGSVHCCITTQNAIIRDTFDTELKLYPVAFMNWETVKNRYHGQSAVECLIPNQLFINKIFAMYMDHVKKLAFPKLIYDVSRFPNGFSNKIGEAIAIRGNVSEAITNAFKMPDLDSSLLAFIDKVYQYTQETMGASDAALGNIRPDNATAIVATQQATTAPLELVRRNFYQFIEDEVRIIIDIMRVNYGTRAVVVEEDVTDSETGMVSKQKVVKSFNFDTLNDYTLNLEVNIGSSAYWSEVMQTQTLSNLVTAGVIQDTELYLESLPDKYVPNKAKLLESVRSQKTQAMQQPMQAPQMPEGESVAQQLTQTGAQAAPFAM